MKGLNAMEVSNNCSLEFIAKRKNKFLLNAIVQKKFLETQ